MLTEVWIGDDLFFFFILGYGGLAFLAGLTLWAFLGLVGGSLPFVD